MPKQALHLLEKTESATGSPQEAKLKKAHSYEYELCAKDFWYWAQFVLTEDEDQKEIRPFPLNYPYLLQTQKDIEENQKVLVLKSRRLMASWLMVLRQLHQAMFAGTGLPGSHDVFRGGLASVGEIEAQYLIQRPTRVYNRLPQWMKDRNPLVTDTKLVMEFQRGGMIQAFPCKREGPQTFGFSEFGFDEIALQEAARSTWTGLLPTLGAEGKIFAVSTPNGRGNFFYRLWHDEDQYKGIKRITLHWGDHPEHDRMWFDAATAGMDKQMIARMFELSFAAYAGQPVWDQFDRLTHVLKEPPDIITTKPMLIGWDFGYHFPAVTFWQINTKDQWVGIKEYEDFDVEFGQFARDVKTFANSFYDRSVVPEIHFIDPAGLQRYHSRSKSGASCDAQEIRNVFGRNAQIRPGADEVGKRNNEGPRMKEVRALWALRADGNPGLVLSPEMKGFIEGCNGGYCYPDKAGDSEVPEKGEASHKQDTLQYAKTGHSRMSGVGSKKKDHQKKFRPRRIGFRTGF